MESGVFEVRETPTVVELDRELDCGDAPEVRGVERRARAGLHLRPHSRDARDRVDRLTQDVAVVQPVAAAEGAGGFA